MTLSVRDSGPRRDAKYMDNKCLGIGLLLGGLSLPGIAAEPPGTRPPSSTCDRNCRVGIMDGFMNAIFQHNPKRIPPPARDVRTW